MQKQVMDKNVKNKLDSINARLDVLTMLYKNILDSLIKTGKVLPDEKRAIETKERLLSENDLYNALKA